MLDVGANVDCQPHNLEQFAVMGEIYYRAIFGVQRPRVGLLSIGQEEHKGNDLARRPYHRLKQLPLNFVGNVEGRDLYNGRVDVDRRRWVHRQRGAENQRRDGGRALGHAERGAFEHA